MVVIKGSVGGKLLIWEKEMNAENPYESVRDHENCKLNSAIQREAKGTTRSHGVLDLFFS